MINSFCTYFDKNYLIQGLSLLESFKKYYNEEFKFYILCLDEYVYAYLKSIQYENVVLLREEDLLKYCPQLIIAKSNRPLIEYYYCFTAALVDYIINTSTYLSVTYIDADMFFFNNLVDLSFYKADIMIVEHKISIIEQQLFGKYNVCFNYFRNNENAKKCIKWWLNKTLESTRMDGDNWGDQKYLDNFPILFDKVKILEPESICLAPWNLNMYDISYKKDSVFVNDKPLICYHFARLIFISDIFFIPARRTYISSYISNTIYKKYHDALILAHKRVKKYDKNYSINYTRRNIKGILLSFLMGRVFYYCKGKVKRFGISIPIGYRKI